MKTNYESFSSSDVDVTIISSLSGKNTGSGTLTSTSTGNDKNDTNIISVNYTNLTTGNLGNTLIKT